MKTSTTSIARIRLVGAFVALAAAIVSLPFVVTWAHTRHLPWPIASDLIVLALVGGIVWTAKRRVLQLRSCGRSATSSSREA